MGVLVPPGYGIAKYRWRCSGDSEEMISTLGFKVGEPAPPSVVAGQLATIYVDSGWGNRLSAAYTFTGVTVSIGPPEAAEVGESQMALVGGLAVEPPPSNCALLVTKITALGGKGNRGRMFLPAGHLQEAGLDSNGFMSAPSLSEAVACNTDWFQAPVSAQYNFIDDWVLFHGSGSGPIADAGTPTVITQFSTHRRDPYTFRVRRADERS